MPKSRLSSLSLENPRSLSDQVAEKLQNAIVERRFTFGENISEEKLAAAFGVSRTPVRDALNSLQFTGLVEVRPKRGSFVFNPTPDEIVQLWEYREILEREACALAMRKNGEVLIGELRDILAQMTPDMPGAEVSFARLDARFHRTFFLRCGNVYLQDAYSIGSARIATLITLFTRAHAGHRQASLADHLKMVECLAAGDCAAFGDVLAAHLGRTLAIVIDHLPAG